MKLFWYSLQFFCDGEFVLDSPPQIFHGDVDAILNPSGEYILEHSVCGIYSLDKPDFGVAICRNNCLIFFTDVNEDEAYRLLREYIGASIKKWNGALVALENSRNFKQMGINIISAT